MIATKIDSLILQPKSVSECTDYAARELAEYIFRITGRRLGIFAENTAPQSARAVYIGNTAKTRAIFAAEFDALGENEFIIAVRDKSLYLFGKESVYSQAGTLYAVYDYLERFCGVRFFAPDEERIPNAEEITFPQEGYFLHEKPDFTVRMPLTADARRAPAFAAKLRIHDPYCSGTPGGAVFPLWEGLQGHNFFDLIPPDEYKDAHPEWFDLENNQLCFCQERLIDEITDKLKEKIRDNPDSVFFALSQNDTVKPCQCDTCKASYEKYTMSGTLIRFVNRAAKEIDVWTAKEFPGRKIYLVTFAYYFSILPPVIKKGGEFMPVDPSIVPHKNVYIYFTTIDYCFYHNLDDPACEWNRVFKDTFEGWRYLTQGRMHVWNYATNYAHYLYPFYNFHTIAHNFKIFKDAGVKQVLDHQACEARHVEFGELRAYLAAKLMWNTSADVRALMSEFVESYYGPCGFAVKEYLRLLEERFKEADKAEGYHLRLYHLPESMFSEKLFSWEFLQKLYACFEQGFKSVENIADKSEREKFNARLMRVSISARYLLLMNYDKYLCEGKEKFAEDYIRDARACGFTKYKEYWRVEDIMD
jgi:hypothetical protein